MVVVGAGRVGTALLGRAQAWGLPVTIVDRSQGWSVLDGAPGTPVLLTVRNVDLADVVRRVPPARRPDLVVLQNGAIRELLSDLGLAGATRAQLYVWAAERGRGFVAAARTPLTGPHADAVAAWFVACGLPAEAVSAEAFVTHEAEKLLWLVVNGWLGQARGATAGELADAHASEVEALVRELVPVVATAWRTGLDPAAVLASIRAWSALIPTCRASVSEDEWRGAWVVHQAALAGLAVPLLSALRSGRSPSRTGP